MPERHIHRFSKFADERTGVQHNTQLLHAFQHRSHLTSKRAEFSHNIIIFGGNGCLAASAALCLKCNGSLPDKADRSLRIE